MATIEDGLKMEFIKQTKKTRNYELLLTQWKRLSKFPSLHKQTEPKNYCKDRILVEHRQFVHRPMVVKNNKNHCYE